MATEKQPTKPTKTATEMLRHEEAAQKEIVKQIGAIEDLRQWLEEMGAPLSLRDAAHECQKFAHSQHYVISQRIQWMTEAKRAEVASGLCSENGKWLTATEKTTNSAIESALRAIDAARDRLLGGAT